MIDREWTEIKALIVASWPSLARVLNIAETEAEWRRALAMVDATTARAGITTLREELSEQTSQYKTIPVLGAFERAMRRELYRQRSARAEEDGYAPKRSMTVAEWEAEKIAEAIDFAARTGTDPGERIACIRTVGPFEQAFLAGGAGALTAVMGDALPAPVAPRPGGPDRALPPEPDDTPSLDDAVVDRAAEAVVAAMREHGPRSIDWHTVPPAVRERARQLLAETTTQPHHGGNPS